MRSTPGCLFGSKNSVGARFLTGFSTPGDLGADVLDESGHGGHATNNDAGVNLHHAAPRLAVNVLGGKRPYVKMNTGVKFQVESCVSRSFMR